jgi:hypothetical protein
MTLCVCWQPQIQSIQEGENTLGMEQNESLKGNAKWVYRVQRRACSGIIWKWWVAAGQNWPVNRICVGCQIWDHQPRQESESEVCLNFVPEWGNTRLYALGKPGIRELYLRIRYINSIAFRLPGYHCMIRDILYWISVRRVEKLRAILLCNRQ